MEYALIVVFVVVGWLVFAFAGEAAIAASSATGLAVSFLVFAFVMLSRISRLSKKLDETERKLEEIKELLETKEE